MVKAGKVGKRRAFWRGFVLTIVTFGIYGIYWNYKAHHEVFSQFDLDDEGKDEGLVWLILGLLFAPLLWVYQYGFVKNIRYIRERLALPPGVTPKAFLTLIILGTGISFVIAIAGQIVLASSLDPAADGETGLSDEELDGLMTFLALIVVSLVVGVVLAAVAYAKLQASINGVWDAYDRRVREVTAPPLPPTGAFGASPAAPASAPTPGARAPWPGSSPPPSPPRER